jgi:hypothetical protein
MGSHETHIIHIHTVWTPPPLCHSLLPPSVPKPSDREDGLLQEARIGNLLDEVSGALDRDTRDHIAVYVQQVDRGAEDMIKYE